jgi:hypothetical protein
VKYWAGACRDRTEPQGRISIGASSPFESRQPDVSGG